MPGLLITVEGIDGAGKSTALSHIAAYFQAKKKQTLITREPGGTEVAEEIRQILLRHHQETIIAETELLLMFAGRAQHFNHVIKPALAEDKVVISGRLTDSSYAYQGGGRGIDNAYIEQLEKLVQQDIHIDLTLLLDLAPEIGLRRAMQSDKLDRIESEKLQFFHQVRDAYLQRAKQYPQRFRIINSEQRIAEVNKAITRALDEFTT
ncbi:MAG: dTMP kinase [Pseudomonadota bacterium]